MDSLENTAKLNKYLKLSIHVMNVLEILWLENTRAGSRNYHKAYFISFGKKLKLKSSEVLSMTSSS